MKPIKRKILLDEGYKMVTLYPYLCKWGTHSVVLCYLFAKPEVGVITSAIKGNNAKSLMHEHIYGVRVTDMIPEDSLDVYRGLVYLEMF